MVGSLGSGALEISELGGALDKITTRAVDSLDSIRGFDTSFLGDRIGNIAVISLSSDNLTIMVEKVTSGATSALVEIEIKSFSADNLTSKLEKVTSGATSSLESIFSLLIASYLQDPIISKDIIRNLIYSARRYLTIIHLIIQ